MGIKFRCHACDKKLHVKAFLAGKRGVCPKCGAKVRIPLSSTETAQDAAAQDAAAQDAAAQDAAVSGGEVDGAVARGASNRYTSRKAGGAPAVTSQETVLAGSVARESSGSGIRSSSAHDPISEAPDAVWYVRPPTGGQFGPADGAIMRRWLNEGRVSADALVWREGWPDWKSAGPVFPTLEGPDLVGPAASAPAASAPAASAPAASAPAASAPAAVSDVHESFAFAQSRPAPARSGGRPHAKASRRHVAIIGVLVVLCVALAVAFVIVLRR